MTISIVTVAKNIIRQGYCWLESLQSTLPFADEIIISDGFSEDDTFYHLKNFKNRYETSHLPILLYQDRWLDKSYHGESIRLASEAAIKKSSKEWVLYLQLDEVWHEKTYEHIRKISNSPYNSAAFPFYHFIRSWKPSNDGYKEAIRMIRNGRDIKLKGDAWTFEGQIYPICPSKLCPMPLFHFAWCFPDQNNRKDIEHSKLYLNVVEYKEKMIIACSNLNQSKNAYPIDPDFNDFPELAKRFIGKPEYALP